MGVIIWFINSKVFFNNFLLTNFSKFVSIDSKTNSIKPFKSPAAASHLIHNNSFQNILHQIQFDKIIKINTIIDIFLSNPAIGNLNKSSSREPVDDSQPQKNIWNKPA